MEGTLVVQATGENLFENFLIRSNILVPFDINRCIRDYTSQNTEFWGPPFPSWKDRDIDFHVSLDVQG